MRQWFVITLKFDILLLRKRNEDRRLQIVALRNNGDVIVIIWILYEIVALIYKSTIDIVSFSNYKCCLPWLKLTDFKNCYIQFPTSSCIKYYLFYWLFNYSCSCLCLYISISKTFNCSIGHILSLKQFISTSLSFFIMLIYHYVANVCMCYLNIHVSWCLRRQEVTYKVN